MEAAVGLRHNAHTVGGLTNSKGADLADAVRGTKDYTELECQAKSRLVVPGFKDSEALEGELRTDAPTLTIEGAAVIGQVATSRGWRLQQGDVDSAFPNGKAMKRFLYVRAPRRAQSQEEPS